MRTFLSLALCLATTALVTVRADDDTLKVACDGKTFSFSAADVAALPHQDVSANDSHEKQTHTYSGVPVRLLLEKAGVVFGEKLRGKGLDQIVIARAKDAYSVVFALAEFDDAFNDRTILIVDKEDGKPVPQGQGPLRLVVPGDKRPARWIRMITSLEVTNPVQ